MLTIQEVGTEILSNKPRKLYIMLGDEWGIKQKYLDLIANTCEGRVVEYPSMAELVKFLKTRRLIPLQKTMFVIRQDETFVSGAQDLAAALIPLKVPGTIVCLYDGDKNLQKFDKVLSDFVVMINKVSKPFLMKYLKQDYPGIANQYIEMVVDIATDYGAAKNICRALAVLKPEQLAYVSTTELCRVFGYSREYTDTQVRMGVAARDFNYLADAMQSFLNDLDAVLYSILSTMLELEKLKCNPHTQSDLSSYVKYWTIEDIYYMFDYTYEEIRRLRSMSSYNPENSILFLFSLLKFSPIPAPEALA